MKLTTPKGDFLFVEVQKEIQNSILKHEIVHKNNETRLYGYDKDELISINHLFDGYVDCELIGITPLTKEQAERIVEKAEVCREVYRYREYRSPKSHPYTTAIFSFQSLMQSKGLDINKKYAVIKIK